MTSHFERARDIASTKGMIVDRETIRKRVAKGDVVFSQRIVLTALIRGNRGTRTHILDRVRTEHFHISHFALLFSWVRDDLKSRDRVDIANLYRRMEVAVQEDWPSAFDPNFNGTKYSAEEVMGGYLALIDHVLAIDMPDAETVDRAIATLQRFQRWRSSSIGKRDTSSAPDAA